MIDYELIRRLHAEGWSVRRIARELHHCRKIINKVIFEWDGSPPRYKLTRPRPGRVVTPEVEAWIEETLRADATAPKKQRHTARRIYSRLPGQFPGLSIGESTVRRLVRAIRKRLKGPVTTMPLAFAPGEEAQVDWWEAEVEIAGKATRLHFLLVVLCHSRRAFAMAFEAANQEAFCEGQVRAFEHLGGIAGRQAYDNLSSAVKRILIGGERQENEFFKAFKVHHGFDVRYCSPGIEGANEKGRVESKVPTVRLNGLVPIPKVASINELNDFLLNKCQELAERPHPDQPEKTVAEVFEEERPFLRPLPRHRFRCCKVVSSKADGHARVQFQTNRYSLPCEYGRRAVETRAFYDRLEFYDGLKLLEVWPRSYERHRTFYNFEHYLALLRKAPGSSLNGAPFLTLPRPLLDYRESLLERFERRVAGRGFAKVLLQIQDYPVEEVVEAVQLGQCYGSIDPEGVINLLKQLTRSWARPSASLDLSGRPSLIVALPKPDLNRYDHLVAGGAA